MWQKKKKKKHNYGSMEDVENYFSYTVLKDKYNQN